MSAPAGGASEAAAFLTAAEDWLRRAASGERPTAGSVRDIFAVTDEHRSDSPCQICPVCQLISLARTARPAVVDHLADAVGSLVLAFRALTDPPATDPREAEQPAEVPVVQEIPII